MPRRTTYTAKNKLAVVAYAEQHGNRAAGRQYDIDETCVRRWCGQKEALAKSRLGHDRRLPSVGWQSILVHARSLSFKRKGNKEKETEPETERTR